MVFINILQPQNIIGFFNNLEDKDFAIKNLSNYKLAYKDQITDPYIMETLYSAIKTVKPSDEGIVLYEGFQINLGDILTFNSFRAKDTFLLTKRGFKLIKTDDFSF